MQYRVIEFFTDLQDFDYPYNAGDMFPRIGKVVSEERLRELSGSQNRQRRPLIEPVLDPFNLPVEEQDNPSENVAEEPKLKAYTKTDIRSMNKAELQELAKSAGVDGADDMTGAELKERILDALGL